LIHRKTIADSKRAFHQAFPYVIPPLYRRLADELLVELHLLSHQKHFKVSSLFSVGLCKVFDSFTKDYRPSEHLNALFEALCQSNNMDARAIRDMSNNILEDASNYKTSEAINWFIKSNNIRPDRINQEYTYLKDDHFHYSRLMAIGLKFILEASKGDETEKELDIDKAVIDISKALSLPEEKVKKDLNSYNNNIEKLNQAVELIKESVKSIRKKRKNN